MGRLSTSTASASWLSTPQFRHGCFCLIIRGVAVARDKRHGCSGIARVPSGAPQRGPYSATIVAGPNRALHLTAAHSLFPAPFVMCAAGKLDRSAKLKRDRGVRRLYSNMGQGIRCAAGSVRGSHRAGNCSWEVRSATAFPLSCDRGASSWSHHRGSAWPPVGLVPLARQRARWSIKGAAVGVGSPRLRVTWLVGGCRWCWISPWLAWPGVGWRSRRVSTQHPGDKCGSREYPGRAVEIPSLVVQERARSVGRGAVGYRQPNPTLHRTAARSLFGVPSARGAAGGLRRSAPEGR